MTKKTFCLFIIFISFTHFIYAQPPVIEENENDTAYINSLIKQGWAAWQTDPEKNYFIIDTRKGVIRKK